MLAKSETFMYTRFCNKEGGDKIDGNIAIKESGRIKKLN